MASRHTRQPIQAPAHQRLIDEAVCTLVERSIGPRILVVQAPPRHGKSELCSVWTPLWFLGKYPGRSVAVATYEANFAATFGRRVRELYQEHGPRLFGASVDPGSRAANQWLVRRHGGGLFATGVGGPLTGRGFHLLVVDDVVKNSKEALSPAVRQSHWDWWTSTALTRLEPGGVAVVIATRWHEDDLTGRLIAAASMPGGEPVAVLDLPALALDDDVLGRQPGEALWPERFSRHYLESLRDASDPFWFDALYQQRPSGARGAEWPASLFGESIWYDREPTDAEAVVRVVATDPSLGRSARADFSAIVTATLARNGYLYVDASIERRDITQLVEDAGAIVRRVRPHVWAIETNAFRALAELVLATWDGLPPPIAEVTQHRDKVDRIRIGAGPLLRRGRILFRRGSDGTAKLVQQLREFPHGRHDDGPDALEMAIQAVAELDAGTRAAIEQASPDRIAAPPYQEPG